MARGLRIDLGKVGDHLPDSLRKAARGAAKAAEKPVEAANAVLYPEDLIPESALEAAINQAELRNPPPIQ